MPFVLLLFLCLSFSTFGQIIQGEVKDLESKKVIPYVHVRLENGENGTITDQSGRFRLRLEKGGRLHFSAIGYTSYFHEVIAPSDTSLTVFLIPDARLLNEIFVYATRLNMLERLERKPIKIPGLLSLDNPKPIEPGTWKWNQMGFNNPSQESPVPIFGIGGTLYGPFSYFSASEKEKRKMKRITREETKLEAYHAALGDDDLRHTILTSFSLTSREYDSLMIIFNREQRKLVENSSQDEASTILFLFFQEHAGL